jgi:hypothetical protein
MKSGLQNSMALPPEPQVVGLVALEYHLFLKTHVMYKELYQCLVYTWSRINYGFGLKNKLPLMEIICKMRIYILLIRIL